jgi:hypothetical protein
MKIFVVDGILEDHCIQALMRAMSRLGHEMSWSGRLWHGEGFPTDEADRARILSAVASGLVGADWVLVMRPASLDAAMVEQLRGSSDARWAVWYADDPVFFESVSVHVARLYDLSLHAGDRRVISLYEDELDVKGWSFPFWVDVDAFPRVHLSRNAQWPFVFVGNTHTGVKRWRYDALMELEGLIAAVGNLGPDPARLGVGRTREPSAAAAYVSRAEAAINFHQRMDDYAGTPYWSPRMAACAEFTLPSRLSQYAAWGIPAFTVTSDSATVRVVAKAMPGVAVVPDALAALTLYREESAEDRRDRADKTHVALRTWHTSDARAALLTWLLERLPEPVGYSIDERAEAFMTEGVLE